MGRTFSVCNVAAKKYGEPIRLPGEATAVMVNVNSNGGVEQFTDEMRFKRRKGFFVMRSFRENKYESPEDAKKNICLACLTRLNRSPGVFAVNVDSENCSGDRDPNEARAAIEAWIKEKNTED